MLAILVESKLGKTSALGKRRDRDEDESDGSEDSSSDEEEDEDGELITEAVDQEIMATLNAIRSKDPRVYNKDVKFYTALEEEEEEPKAPSLEKKDKPMTLRDYHRENLLSGANLAEDDAAETPKTYAQEQEDLKSAIVKEMHAAAEDEDSVADEDNEDGGFLIPKSTTKRAPEPKEEIKLDRKSVV